MALQLKSIEERARFVESAARRRIQDVPYVVFPEEEIAAAVRVVSQRSVSFSLNYGPNDVVTSGKQRDLVKDWKMQINLLNEEGVAVADEISRFGLSTRSLVKDLQKEVASLEAQVQEDQLISQKGYTRVHVNSFVRAEDQGVDANNNSWMVDPKSRLGLISSNVCDYVAGGGLTLPLDSRQDVGVRTVSVLTEDTTAGFVLSGESDPVDIVRDNRPWRHVVVVPEYQEGVALAAKPAKLTLLFEMFASTVANCFELEVLGANTLLIEQLRYQGLDGVWTPLDFYVTDSLEFQTVFFAPVRARAFKIQFVQYAPVGKTDIVVKQGANVLASERLEAAGFSQFPTYSSTPTYGRVYDFSLQNIRFCLKSYNGLGIFRSQELALREPTGFELTHVSRMIARAEDHYLPADVVLPEFWLALTLKAGNNSLSTVLPLVDDHGIQREILPIVGREGQMKFLPDLSVAGEGFDLYANDQLLTIGTDYHISLNGGATWYVDWSSVETDFASLLDKSWAGRARVKILDLDRNALYWCAYQHERRQKLVSDGTIMLRGDKVVVDQPWRTASGTCQVLTIMRAASRSTYGTPVVQRYALKVRESVR
jgi:hypothetical protein